MTKENNRKAPRVRFPGFTDDWKQRKLSECAGFRRGSFPQPYGNKEWYDGEGAMPFVQVADVSDDMKLVDDTKQKISKLAQPMSVYADKGSVLVTLQGSIGRVAITQYGAFVDRTVLIFDKYNQDINKTFWAYIIKEKFVEEARKAPGGTIKTITKEALSDFDLMLPNYDEQKKIGAFFVSIDNLITLHQRELTNLEMQKKAVMKKIFSQEVRFKRADGSDFPEWEAKDFKEEADYLSGLTYSPDDVVLNPDDGILVLRSSNIQGGIIDYQDNVFVKCKIADNLFVQENDVLMCVRNGSKKLVGKTALIKKSDLGHTWGAFMMIIRSHTDNRFIYHYLNSDKFYKQMFPDVNTATIAQITKGMLNDCMVEMPCLEEQRLIADFLSDFDEAIAAAKKELELWKELKKGLLQQMFV